MFSWGELYIKVTSASITSFLDRINFEGICLKQIEYVDDLNLKMRINLKDYSRICEIVRKRGDKLETLHRNGSYYTLKKLAKRPVLIVFMSFWIFLVMFLPSRILFFQVEGNKNVSDYEILNAAQECGVYFGAARRYVKSEKVKNALLSQVQQLKWVGVNTKGCVATISVKESAIPERNNDQQNFGNMVATVDGVITDITITSGNPVCKVGQAVRKGQVLVSGYTDCGLYVKADEIKGEVYGVTRRNVSASVIHPSVLRGAIISENTNYSIQFGKKNIKFKKSSGILDTGCVKMYDKIDIVLPGGFCLPISIIKETEILYGTHKDIKNADLKLGWADEAIQKLCLNEMIAGEIITCKIDKTEKDTGYIYAGYYICEEMIGRVHTEELFVSNGKRNS